MYYTAASKSFICICTSNKTKKKAFENVLSTLFILNKPCFQENFPENHIENKFLKKFIFLYQNLESLQKFLWKVQNLSRKVFEKICKEVFFWEILKFACCYVIVFLTETFLYEKITFQNQAICLQFIRFFPGEKSNFEQFLFWKIT